MNKVLIREELPQDFQDVRAVNIQAFKRKTEADLVDKLRNCGCDSISLVAIVDDKLVGHILFSPIEVIFNNKKITGMGLAPMAVMPEYQKQGIGSSLITEGIKKAKDKKYPLIVVLGHPEYYPRFGFVPASKFNLKSEYNVPDEVFMALVFDESQLSGNALVKYRQEFNDMEC